MSIRNVIFAGFLVFAQSLFAGTIPADNENFQYTGRVDFSDKKAPVITWPGTCIKAKFTGTSLKVILDDREGKNFFDVYIDGDYSKPHRIACKKGKATCDVVDDLEKSTHTMLLFKRTEGEQGSTAFHGVVLDEGGKLEKPEKRPELGIEIIGDSISCGLENEGKKKESNVGSNNFMSYGAITARELDAEYMCIAKSGIGMIESWFPITMPQYYDRLHANSVDLKADYKKWDFEKWQPDIVVINLFQNDSWVYQYKKNKKKRPSDKGCVQAYVDFVKTVRKHNPKAHIFCTLGSMSASKTKWADYVKSAAEQMVKSGDKKVHSYIFKTKTGNRHPNVKEHKRMAKELTEVIKKACDIK